MHKPKIMLWLHDSNKTASGKPGAVQYINKREEEDKLWHQKKVDKEQYYARQKTRSNELRTQKEEELRAYYQRKDWEDKLDLARQNLERNSGFFGWLTGRKARYTDEVAGIERTLEDIDMRINERLGMNEQAEEQQRSDNQKQASSKAERPDEDQARESQPDIVPEFEDTSAKPPAPVPDPLTPEFDREAYTSRRLRELSKSDDETEETKSEGRTEGRDAGPDGGITR